MSSQFLTFIFIILVSVQISSCGWGFPWQNGKEEKTSTESTTVKNFKDDKPNSPSEAAIIIYNPDSEEPKEKFVLSVDNDEDESSKESSAQSTKTTLENVSAMPNEEPDEYSEEDSSKFPNSGKEIKWIPTTSTNSTDKIVNYVSSVSTQITVSSTTEESESESSTIDNSNTSTSTENTLNGTDVNNVPRNVDEDRDGAEGISSVVSSSTIPSSLENSNFEIESVNNSSETILPEVSYAPNVKDVSSSIDEEKEPTSDKQSIERKDKETHSPRNVTDKPDYSTQKTTFEDYESGNSSTAMTNMPTTSENTLNYTSNNEARNVIDDTENSGNSSKSETVSDLDPSASMQANTTIETILSTSTATMNTTEMAGPMSNGTTPEVNFGSFVNSGSTSNTYSQLILNLCILIFSISVIV